MHRPNILANTIAVQGQMLLYNSAVTQPMQFTIQNTSRKSECTPYCILVIECVSILVFYTKIILEMFGDIILSENFLSRMFLSLGILFMKKQRFIFIFLWSIFSLSVGTPLQTQTQQTG